MTNFSDIAIEVSKLVNDYYDCDSEYNFTRWKKCDLEHYAKDAVQMIYMLYPKKFTTIKEVILQPGKVQMLPEGCNTLTKVIDTDIVGAKSSIASNIDDRLGNLFDDKCSETVTSKNYVVKNYSLEESATNIFYVDPPVPNDGKEVKIKVICSEVPETDVENFKIQPWMHNAIIEWVLYRAYSSEDESQNAMNDAKTHLEHFYAIVRNYITAQENLLPRTRVVSNEASQ